MALRSMLSSSCNGLEFVRSQDIRHKHRLVFPCHYRAAHPAGKDVRSKSA